VIVSAKGCSTRTRQHRELIGLTSGHRDADELARLFHEEVRLAGSPEAARRRVLPPEQSRHVAAHRAGRSPNRRSAGRSDTTHAPYALDRIYDNEWWHFERAVKPNSTKA
jgi:hypothetical protein